MKTLQKTFFLVFLLIISNKADSLITNGRACDGVDARDVKQLQNQLEDCQIIEGSIKISAQDEDFTNISFPLLTEIAGYLMIYKTTGLKSVAHIFPNLAAIRGGELFKDYAMILYENALLENVGLNHLKALNGAVRIEKNKKLCYVNTINWKKIMSNETYGKSLFEGNMEIGACPTCEKGVLNCWTEEKPQTVCKCNGNSCNLNGTCCEPSCLSCLDASANSFCSVCKKLIAGIFPTQKCVESCPYRTFEHLKHRCITGQECRNLNINVKSDVPFIPFQGICSQGCPDEFKIKYALEGNKMSASCSPCLGRECWRKCKSVKIDSFEAAASLKGCQIIEGPLDIQIKPKPGVNVPNVLMSSLSEIVEIEDYLKISRSFPIMTLHFLRNLKVIRGTRLESNKYSIVFWDNENLETLFEDDQKLEIKNGKLFIHLNPKLCFEKIEKLSKLTLQSIENLENAKNSNGHRTCNTTQFDVELLEVTSKSAQVRWKSFLSDSNDTILEYVIFYIETFNQSVDLWYSRDTCGNDGWTALDVIDFSSESDTITFTLPQLQAYTQYAFYVEAFTSSQTKAPAQSKIQYFSTLAGLPETVESLSASVKSDSEIVLTWTQPKHINGELEMFQIEIRKLQVIKRFLEQRNFCEHHFDEHEENLIENATNEPKIGTQKSLDFEDEIHDLFNSRNKRSIECRQEIPKEKTENLLRLEIVGPEKRDFVIKALSHYSSYAISVRACRKENNRSDEHLIESGLCSADSQVIAKTFKSDTADDIEDFELTVLPSNSSEHQVQITWIPPKNPNGKVLNYVVKQSRVDVPELITEIICISLFQRENACSQVIDKIKPGKYSFQILASTLTGDGNYTVPKYVFIKPVSHLSLIASPAFMALVFLIVASIALVSIFVLYQRNQPPEVVSRFENFESEDHPMNAS